VNDETTDYGNGAGGEPGTESSFHRSEQERQFAARTVDVNRHFGLGDKRVTVTNIARIVRMDEKHRTVDHGHRWREFTPGEVMCECGQEPWMRPEPCPLNYESVKLCEF
jgi:hypothetical protein